VHVTIIDGFKNASSSAREISQTKKMPKCEVHDSLKNETNKRKKRGRKYMKQKKHVWEAMVAVGVVLAVLLPGSTVVANNQAINLRADGLDQHQETTTENSLLPVGRITIPDVIDSNFQIAQSFIPQKAILTRIELSIGKNVTTSYPFSLGVRDVLTNPDIVTTDVAAEQILTGNFTWVEFDIPDTWVTVGKTYYIVCYTENITDNWYGWAANNISESYPNGCAWVSIDDGDTWSNDSVDFGFNENHHQYPKADENATWDMVFRTYGLDSTNLVIDYQTGLLRSKFIINNAGSTPAYDVDASAHMTGGILNGINITSSMGYWELPASESLELVISGLIGFGPVTISVVAHATNAEEVSTELHGFAFFIFLFVSGS
jgi:hypothetical protein